MNIIGAVTLEKYKDAERYLPIEGLVFEDLEQSAYYLTMQFGLEAGEDPRYPLEDLLDQYHVRCTKDRKEFREEGVHVLQCELEGTISRKDKNLPNLQAMAALAGGRAYNYTEGGVIKFKVDPPAPAEES